MAVSVAESLLQPSYGLNLLPLNMILTCLGDDGGDRSSMAFDHSMQEAISRPQ
jgi:hypothetical protein